MYILSWFEHVMNFRVFLIFLLKAFIRIQWVDKSTCAMERGLMNF